MSIFGQPLTQHELRGLAHAWLLIRHAQLFRGLDWVDTIRFAHDHGYALSPNCVAYERAVRKYGASPSRRSTRRPK